MVCDFSYLQAEAPVDPWSPVWIVSSEQLLAWVQDPTSLTDLDDFAPLKCYTPQVNAKICNGMPGNEVGLLDHCGFLDSPFDTCVRPNPAE